ncbi:MAG: nucleotidyltransferase family protein [Thermoplasmata archaeon]
MRELGSSGVSAIVLASGFSRRFSSNKLLLPLGNETVIGMTVRHVMEAGIPKIAAVIPDGDSMLKRALPESVDKICNPDRDEGIASSIRAGVNRFMESGDAVLIMNGDQPLLPPSIIKQLIDLFTGNKQKIAACSIGGEPVNPAIFPHVCLADLMALKGDRGAKPLILRNMKKVVTIDVDPVFLTDIDTDEDYETVLRVLEKIG